MSRNKQHGKYAGKLQGKHYRSRGVNVSVSTLDCHIEQRMREQKQSFAMYEAFVRSIPWSDL